MSDDSTLQAIATVGPKDDDIAVPLMTGLGKIPVDTSITRQIHDRITTSAGKGQEGGVTYGPACLNKVNVEFDSGTPADAFINPYESYILVKGYAADMYNHTDSTHAIRASTSIPWNTISALVENAKLFVNKQSTAVEEFNEQIGHSSMVKMLETYTADALERGTDQWFTPCIEDTRDTNTGTPTPNFANGLSTQSIQRRDRNLVDEPGGAVKPISKVIYLADLFDSLKQRASYKLFNVRVEIKFKPSNEILFTDLGSVDPDLATAKAIAAEQRFFVTYARIEVVYNVLSEAQKAKYQQLTEQSQWPYKNSFTKYEASVAGSISAGEFKQDTLKNLQSATLLFPSTDCKDGIGVNPYQYCWGSGATAHTGITSFRMKYDGKYSPENAVEINAAAYGENAEVYELYRACARKRSNPYEAPAIAFHHMAVAQPDVYDYSSYVLLCANFYPLDASSHKLLNGAPFEITVGGTDVKRGIVIKKRQIYWGLSGNGTQYITS